MQSRRYTVTVQGRLGERFRVAFPGVSIEPDPGHTRLITEPFDQAQLHGLFNRVRDFGIDILAVEAIPPDPPPTTRPPADRGSKPNRALHPNGVGEMTQVQLLASQLGTDRA